MQELNATLNEYGGIYVSPADLPDSGSELTQRLAVSLYLWKKRKIKVVWVRVPVDRVNFLALFYQAGFENHHCRANFFMLTKRLQLNALIPSFANHTIGVGGVVINDKRELLAIREKRHVGKYPHHWKFPGGMLEDYEKIEQGVVREVEEETGIKTQFEHFVGFLHHNNGQFETSNIYVACKLKALSHQIVIQESEIADARWFPIDDYLNDEQASEYNKRILKSVVTASGLKREKLSPEFYLRDYELFCS